MYIKSYRSDRFAGIKDMELDFIDGLNIILGPNESGKSTIINGMYSALFKDINIKRNNNKDIEFSYKFMPRSEGDTIDSSLVLRTEEGDYSIKRQWGEDKSVKLRTPEDNIIRNSEGVEKTLKEILVFGETTYSNIVFAKQEDLNSVLQNILEDSSFKREIGDLLRRALMELDGVSVEKIEESIDEELDSIHGRWDIEKSYPQNNRGVHNPYVNGLGSVIKSYYKKEELKIKMDKANRSEKDFENISNELSKIEDLRIEYLSEKDKLEALEEDINKRSILELQIETLGKDLEELMDIVKKWPNMEEEIDLLEREKSELEEEKLNLEQDKTNLLKLDKRIELENKLKKIEKTYEEIEELEEKLKEIPKIEIEDIRKLEKLDMKIKTLEVSLNAGELVAILNRKDIPISISKDFEDIEEFSLGENVKAENSIKVIGKEFEFEIKIGERDFEKINLEMKELKEKFREKLNNLNIANLEEGKINREKIESYNREINYLHEDIKRLLGENDLGKFKSELKELEKIKIEKSEDELNRELNDIKEKEIRIISERNLKKAQLKDWIERYEDFESVFSIVGENSFNVKSKKSQLQKLKSLPEEFESVEEFKERLSFLKGELDRIQGEVKYLNEKYYEMKNELLDETYEELKLQSIDLENEFERHLNRGKKLLRIKEEFQKTKNRMISNPLEPLIKEFSDILAIITEGKYSTPNIEETFEINLENNGKIIPFDLLSAGTYDSVSLALRFALLKYLYDGEDGFLILDDPLVDLDPRRKQEAISLIKEFAKKYQIIFTTCSPETAKKLGGNLIEL